MKKIPITGNDFKGGGHIFEGLQDFVSKNVN